jgi:signal transduction histidine kinase
VTDSPSPATPGVLAPGVAASGVPAPGLSALRQARARRAELRRHATPFAIGVVGFIAWIGARQPPYLGWHGTSLGLGIGLAGLVVGILGARQTLLIRRASPRVYWPVLLLLLSSAATLVLLQPKGPGVIGFMAVVALVVQGRAVSGRAGIVVLSAGCTLVLLAIAFTAKQTGHSGWVGVLVSVVPFLIALPAAALFWRIREQNERTELLMLELEETRGVELRAVALAERQRLARDMHDVLAHTLSGLSLQLEGARLLARSGGDERLAATIDRAHQLAKSGLAEARQAIGMLRGDDLPGPERLADLAGDFSADTGVPCAFSSDGEPAELRAEVRLTLYRVTQEALTNVRKHAHPDRVDVALSYCGDRVCLTVQDFGAGPPLAPGSALVPGPALAPGPPLSRESDEPAAAPHTGYGLTGMRERAELLGGTLSAGPADTGFLVELRVPA